MDFSSWVRKKLLKKTTTGSSGATAAAAGNRRSQRQSKEEEEEEEQLGLTEELRQLLKSFTIETFTTFPLQDDQETTAAAAAAIGDDSSARNVQKDLSDWQERHATLVLSRVKEIAQLRYVLCPCHLKDGQFWRIYFLLVKSYISPYELRAIREEKLKRMGMKEEISQDRGFEVEMAETKQTRSLSPTDSLEC